MHTKDESVAKVETFLKWIMSQNRIVKFMRCDSDPIFKGSQYTPVTKSYQVKVLSTAPHKPTQKKKGENPPGGGDVPWNDRQHRLSHGRE